MKKKDFFEKCFLLDDSACNNRTNIQSYKSKKVVTAEHIFYWGTLRKYR